MEDKLRVDAKTWCHSFGKDIPRFINSYINATWDILVKIINYCELGLPYFLYGANDTKPQSQGT